MTPVLRRVVAWIRRHRLQTVGALILAYLVGIHPEADWKDGRASYYEPVNPPCERGYRLDESTGRCLDTLARGSPPQPTPQPRLRAGFPDSKWLGLYLDRPNLRIFRISLTTGLEGFGICRFDPDYGDRTCE